MTNSAPATRFGLPQITIDKINAVFAKHPELEKAVLYGSRAKGTYKVGSDIDLSLFGDTLSYAQLSHIETEIDDLMLPYSFDISLFKHISNIDLVEHINRIGITFYQKTS